MVDSEFQKIVLELIRELKADMQKQSETFTEQLRELKTDMRNGFEQVDKRFEQVDKRFEQVDKRFEQVDKKIEELKEEIRDVKQDIRADKSKLQEVYESREKVKITFGWQWGMISFFIALIAVGMSKIFA